MTIRPVSHDCSQPFAVTAIGLAPLQPVEVTLTTPGQAATGGVGGTSDVDGVFISPFPRINLPCATGGTVTATIRVGGELLAITAQFQILPPGATPAPPSTGSSAGGPASEDWMLLSVIGAGFLLLTLVILLIGPRRDGQSDEPPPEA